MKINDINMLLRISPYPGRGIILGRSEDGKRSVQIYFIMGRSENSRNRVFESTPDGIRTKAFDPSKMTDPSLVIYHPVRAEGGRTVVTNGAQTDTIAEYLREGRSFRDALYQWEFEPDPPIYTPRISGLVEQDGSYSLSILKASAGNPACCQRSFFEYSSAVPATGHFISTYISEGVPPPSFDGEPLPIKIADGQGLPIFANNIWESLNQGNKVALYARETDLATGETRDLIINKNV